MKTISEGLYQIDILNERIVVDVKYTMQGKSPETKEVLMAHPLSGKPRFPWTIKELFEWGAVFKKLN